jgi:hypothetical protein
LPLIKQKHSPGQSVSVVICLRACGPGMRVEGKLFDFENGVFENEQGQAALMLTFHWIEGGIEAGQPDLRDFSCVDNAV